MGFCPYSPQQEFRPYPSKHWNSYLILPNIPFHLSYRSKHCNSFLISPNIRIPMLSILNTGILILFFQTLEFLSHPSKHFWILTLSFRIIIGIFSYPSNHWTSYLILANTRILILSFEKLHFLSYSSKHWNSYFVFQTLEFLSHPSKHWNSYVIFQDIRILLICFQHLEFLFYPPEH